MPAYQYFDHPSNLAFHDLTSTLPSPLNLKSLLGLGLKFIPTPPATTLFRSLEQPDKTIPYLDRSMRLKCFFVNHRDLDSDSFNPRMHIPSDWEPPPQFYPPSIALRMNRFYNSLRPFYVKSRIRTNILPYHRHALNTLRNQHDLLVVQCDKNLGPAIIERDWYIQLAYSEHLCNPNVYRRLNDAQMETQNNSNLQKLLNWMRKHKQDFSKNERKFLNNYLRSVTDPIPKFYLLMKVHKPTLSTRPIVS